MINRQINMTLGDWLFASGCIIAGVTGIIFIIMKICGVLGWSWLWVTAPFWIPIEVCLAIIAVLVVIAGIRYFNERRKRRIWR